MDIPNSDIVAEAYKVNVPLKLVAKEFGYKHSRFCQIMRSREFNKVEKKQLLEIINKLREGLE